MEKVWLTDELDNTPYSYNKEKVEKFIKHLNLAEKYDSLNAFLEKNPKAKRKILSEEYRRDRFYHSALSFYVIDSELEKKEHLDLSNITDEQAIKLSAYYDACKTAHELSLNPNFYIDQNFMIYIHRILCSGEKDKNLIIKYRLRNASDPTIMIGQGYFQPVKGKDVDLRVALLLSQLYFQWADDNIFVKGAKFVTEYVRIQPHMDGNKRMALILLNSLFESQPNGGLPNIYFTKKQISDLYQHIKESMVSRDVTKFANYLAEQVSNRYDDILDKAETYEIARSIDAIKEKK